MSDLSTGGDAGSEGIPAHVPSGIGELSTREAARSLTDWRNKLRAGASEGAIDKATSQPTPVSQPERAPPAPAADQSADAETGSPERETTDEGQAQAPDSESPTIEPPPSWTKDAHERWSKLDRETQEYLVTRDREDNAAVKRKFQEADEQLKGLTAREQAMEQQTRQMEAINRAQLQALHQQLQGEFADIRDEHDMQKLAAEDPFRFSRWQAHQSLLAVKSQQEQEAQRRQAEAAQTAFTKFAQEQDKKFIERVPEFADKEKASKLQEAAVEMLTDVGFTREELFRHWHGQEFISLRDARLQEAFNDAAKYREAQKAAKKAVTNKTLPPVQRPGVAQQGNRNQEELRALEKRIDNTTGHEQLRLLSKRKALLDQASSRPR